jgi:3'(2'), 5'-bisphosphate nucleotidase
MSHNSYQEWAEEAIKAAFKAGEKVLEVYEDDHEVETKEDKSPLTLADRRSHEGIKKRLEATDIPVLSEEGKDIPYPERASWNRFWMIDPLDGTKEFIKKNGEFTINIALIEEGEPVLGVILVPAKDELYFALKGSGAYKTTEASSHRSSSLEELMEKADRLPYDLKRDKFTAVASRSHMNEDTESYIEELKKEHGEVELTSIGSSLKLCLVAEGKADVYPRFGPTMEWDTAAGHAIAKEAGKEVVDHSTSSEMVYNKEDLHNNWFIVR